MSSAIWTPAALSSEHRPYRGRGWRFVEAQHKVSTLKLVDDLAEQELLEQIVEETKPAIPPECRGLDYLLSTPFRYRPIYPSGSRFRKAGFTKGVFYAAEQEQTAAAEIVFYRYLFHAESPGTPWPKDAAEYSAFSVELATTAAIDLNKPPLNRDEALWCHLTEYAPCQLLDEAAREAGAEIIRYRSVRDPARGANLAVLTCTVFASPAPVQRNTWRIRIGSRGAQAIREFPPLGLEFKVGDFGADERLRPLIS
jgi:hypothetical protein